MATSLTWCGWLTDGLAASRKRAVTIIGPMADLVLATPGMNPDVSELARVTLQLAEGG
jgi:hypothetical protein